MTGREALAAALMEVPERPARWHDSAEIAAALAAAGVYLVTAETLAEAMHRATSVTLGQARKEAAAILATLSETSACPDCGPYAPCPRHDA